MNVLVKVIDTRAASLRKAAKKKSMWKEKERKEGRGPIRRNKRTPAH